MTAIEQVREKYFKNQWLRWLTWPEMQEFPMANSYGDFIEDCNRSKHVQK